jgi:prefoldin subunit 5
MDLLDARSMIEKISVDMENMAYQITALQDEIAILNAQINETKESTNDIRRVVTK